MGVGELVEAGALGPEEGVVLDDVLFLPEEPEDSNCSQSLSLSRRVVRVAAKDLVVATTNSSAAVHPASDWKFEAHVLLNR